jgi:hypothetical protein
MGHVAFMGEKWYACKALVGKAEGKSSLGIPIENIILKWVLEK